MEKQGPIFGSYKVQTEYFNNPKRIYMTQKEKLETLTGETFPEPTPQENYRQQLEGTPFWIIQDKTGYNLVMGKYRLNNEPIQTLSLLHVWIEQNKWNIQLSMTICIVTDMLNEQQEKQKMTASTIITKTN